MFVNVLPSEIAVSKVHEMFDGDGETMTDEKMKKILENLGASLVDMCIDKIGYTEILVS